MAINTWAASCPPLSPPEPPAEAVREWRPCWNLVTEADGGWEDYAMSPDELNDLLPDYISKFGTFTVRLLENDL
jgi:hypothetical protein